MYCTTCHLSVYVACVVCRLVMSVPTKHGARRLNTPNATHVHMPPIKQLQNKPLPLYLATTRAHLTDTLQDAGH
jgi:hypothetical protein